MYHPSGSLHIDGIIKTNKRDPDLPLLAGGTVEAVPVGDMMRLGSDIHWPNKMNLTIAVADALWTDNGARIHIHTLDDRTTLHYTDILFIHNTQ